MIDDKKIGPSPTKSKLFSVGQITLAAFLGSPIAGCLLLARNYRELGKGGTAWQALLAGTASSILVFLLAFCLPENFPNMALPFAYCFGLRQLTKYLQGEAISNHFMTGGRRGSWVITIVIGLGCMAVIFVLLFGLIIVVNPQ
jgi:hypothetical protein